MAVGSAQGSQVSLPDSVLTSSAGAVSKPGSSLTMILRSNRASGMYLVRVMVKSAQPGVTTSPTAYLPDLKPCEDFAAK